MTGVPFWLCCVSNFDNSFSAFIRACSYIEDVPDDASVGISGGVVWLAARWVGDVSGGSRRRILLCDNGNGYDPNPVIQESAGLQKFINKGGNQNEM